MIYFDLKHFKNKIKRPGCVGRLISPSWRQQKSTPFSSWLIQNAAHLSWVVRNVTNRWLIAARTSAYIGSAALENFCPWLNRDVGSTQDFLSLNHSLQQHVRGPRC